MSGMDLRIYKTATISKEIISKGIHEIIEGVGFMLTDIIVNSTGHGLVTVKIVDDDNHTLKIISLRGDDRFNHGFIGGLQSWTRSRLVVDNTLFEGFVDITVSHVKISSVSYDQWLRIAK